MIALLQRVRHAEVLVADQLVGRIAIGLLALIGVQRGDDEATAERLLERLLNYRVFADSDGRMNLSLRQVHGGLLLVPQFTLAADTSSGTRPGFSTAAPAAEGRRLFDYLAGRARVSGLVIQTGEFGADMQVSLTNDGPVTFWLQVAPKSAATAMISASKDG